MKIRTLVRELRRKLRKNEESTTARLKRAALYREIGRGEEAVELYRSVVADYIEDGRIAQAIAVSRSALDIDPGDAGFRELLAELERMRAEEPQPKRHRHGTASGEEGEASEDDVRDWAPSLARSRSVRAASSIPFAAGQEAARPRAASKGEGAGDGPAGVKEGAGSGRVASGVVGEDADAGKSGGSQHLSRALLTPTPLPAPLPAHEADEDSLDPQQLRIDPAPAGPLPQIPLPRDLEAMDDDLFDMPPPADMVGAPFDDEEEDQTYLAEALPVPGGDEGFTLLDNAVTGAMAAPAPAMLADAAGTPDDDQEPTQWRDSSRSLEADMAALDLDADPASMPAETTEAGAEVENRATFVADHGGVPGAPVSDGAPEMIVDEEKTVRRVVPETLGSVMAAGDDAIAQSSRLELLRAAFAALPEEAVSDLADRVSLRSLAAGELVFDEGDPGDACFLVESGEVRALRRDSFISGEPSVEVCRWGPAALFGELALLADRRRHASAQAVGACNLYEIPRRILRELAATYPDVGPLLDSLYRERLLSMLIDTAPFLSTLSGERRAALLGRFQSVRRDSGDQIIREGTTTGGLYLVVMGSVEITQRVSAKRSSLLATFVEGAYFGDMSFVDGEAAGASVSAAGPVELAVLPPEDFLDVVAESPGIWAQIRRAGRRPVLESTDLLTGEIPIA